MHIQIAPNKKIDNPFKYSDVSNFEGDINLIDLKTQKKNYDMIQSKLSQFNNDDFLLNYIWHAQFTRCNKIITHFVATSNNKKIFWRKYEGQSEGSGNNFIYINGNKYKTTDFICWNHQTFIDKLNL